MTNYSISSELSDEAIQQVLGERLAQQRISAALTQAQLAQRAGVSPRTVVRMEAGQGGDLRNLIRVLRALGLATGFNALVPVLPPSPIEQLKLRGKQRQRVRTPRKPAPAAPTGSPWRKTS
jgi:transcriptional regulator with XRE-family HTH domain